MKDLSKRIASEEITCKEISTLQSDLSASLATIKKRDIEIREITTKLEQEISSKQIEVSSLLMKQEDVEQKRVEVIQKLQIDYKALQQICDEQSCTMKTMAEVKKKVADSLTNPFSIQII